jgi:hypothetical protein
MIILLVLDKKSSPMAAASLWVIEVSIDGSWSGNQGNAVVLSLKLLLQCQESFRQFDKVSLLQTIV